MKIDVEKIKTAYEAASAEQKEQIEKMFPGAFECAKSEDSEETLETLVDKLKAWQDQNADNRAVALFAVDQDRTKEEGNTAICITGNSKMLLNLAVRINMQGDIKNPFARLFALALMGKIKNNLENSKHGTDN
nr:MAG TPA: hypothetical protein [Caudoviricetes sp.]